MREQAWGATHRYLKPLTRKGMSVKMSALFTLESLLVSIVSICHKHPICRVPLGRTL